MCSIIDKNISCSHILLFNRQTVVLIIENEKQKQIIKNIYLYI